MFIPLLLIRYHLLFAVRVDVNSKKVIDSHLILKIEFSLFDCKLILTRFQEKLPLIVKISKIECNKVIPLVLDESQ